MRPDDLPEIRHLPLFRDMLQSNFEQLMQASDAQAYPAGTELIRQGGPADYLHIVLDGSVELYSHWGEQTCTMEVVQPLGTFILAACIKDAPYLMSARTLEKSRVVRVPASDLRAVFRRDPEFAVSTITELATHFRIMVRHAKGLKLRNSRERIAAYLLNLSRQQNGAAQFPLQVEKKLIASYLGMTPENFSRALRTLDADGVRISGTTVQIHDPARLAALARLDPLIDGPEARIGSIEAASPRG